MYSTVTNRTNTQVTFTVILVPVCGAGIQDPPAVSWYCNLTPYMATGTYVQYSNTVLNLPNMLTGTTVNRFQLLVAVSLTGLSVMYR
jgi:hypothetical protein